MPQTVRFRKSRKRWVNNRFDLGTNVPDFLDVPRARNDGVAPLHPFHAFFFRKIEEGLALVFDISSKLDPRAGLHNAFEHVPKEMSACKSTIILRCISNI
jgi:hypothetical protein